MSQSASTAADQDVDLLLLKRKQATLLRQKLDAVRRFGLPFYRPFPKQDQFHRAYSFKRRMGRTGNRFGKSTMGVAEDCAWMLRERPWYAESDPARRGGIPQHPIKLLTITTDWDKVDEIFTSQRGEGGKVWRFLPSDFVVPHGVRRNHSGCIDTIEGRNGSLWRFDTVKSFMSNPQGSESSDWDAIHVDEPIPEDMWKASSRGLIDRGGAAWFTFTPLKEFWINDYFFPQETGGKARNDVFAMSGSIYDNIYLKREDIDAYAATLTDEEKQCRINGIPLHLAGLIYKEFSWADHVMQDLPKDWTDFAHPPVTWPVYVAIDPHPQTPHAVLFCAVDPFGNRYYFNDIFVHCGIKHLVRGDASRNIRGILPSTLGHRIVWAKMDPLGFIEDPEDEYSMALEAGDAGLVVEKATKALAQGILFVQQELKRRDLRGKPTIRFSPECRRTLWEIQRYAWDEKENKPVDKDDHMMENLYRLELSRPRWIEPVDTSAAVGDIEITQPELDLKSLAFAD